MVSYGRIGKKPSNLGFGFAVIPALFERVKTPKNHANIKMHGNHWIMLINQCAKMTWWTNKYLVERHFWRKSSDN